MLVVCHSHKVKIDAEVVNMSNASMEDDPNFELDSQTCSREVTVVDSFFCEET
jgi:hypothetical protein